MSTFITLFWFLASFTACSEEIHLLLYLSSDSKPGHRCGLSVSMAFKSLPLEVSPWLSPMPVSDQRILIVLFVPQLNKEIAGYLEDDQDVCNFRLVCLDTLHAVDGDNFHFWRKRYLSHFEWSDAIDENSQFAVVYQHRRRQLRGGARFRNGATRAELWCLQAIAHILIGRFKLRGH